jgi:flagellar hook-associated protein 3 FlgL
MTRISTFAHSQTLLDTISRHQSDIQKSQLQLSTGKKGSTYSTYGAESSAIISTRHLKSTAQGFADTNKQLGTRLDISAVQLQSLYESASAVRDSVRGALSQGRADGLVASLEGELQASASALNSQFNGRYLFGGARATVAPVAVTSLSDLAGLASPTLVIRNDNLGERAQITDGVSVTVGPLAVAVGEGLFSSLHALAQLNQSQPLTGGLSASQTSSLSAQLSQLDTAIAQIQSAQGELGVVQSKVESQAIQSQNRTDDLERFLSNVEDVNVAEVITRLQAQQTALQASYKVTSDLSQLSLLKYI